MPKETKLALICRAEGVVYGWIEGHEGKRVDRAHLRRNFRPQPLGTDGGPRPSSHREELGMTSLYEATKDGAMLTCPRCGNATVLGLEGQSISEAIRDDLRPVLGFFSMPVRGAVKQYAKGKSTPDPLKAQPPMEVVDAED